MPEDGDAIKVRVGNGGDESDKKEDSSETPTIKANSSPIMAAHPESKDDESNEEQQVVVAREAQKVIEPLSSNESSESSESSESPAEAKAPSDADEDSVVVAESESPSPSESSNTAIEGNEDRKTVADMADHTQTMTNNKTRNYKITPNKLKKSPARRRSQNVGVVTTVIFFIGIIAVIVGSLWVFMPGFSDSLLELIGF